MSQMQSEMPPAQPDQVVAVRPSGSTLHYSRTVDGMDMGYIVGEDGTKYNEMALVSLLARGYWEAPV